MSGMDSSHLPFNIIKDTKVCPYRYFRDQSANFGRGFKVQMEHVFVHAR